MVESLLVANLLLKVENKNRFKVITVKKIKQKIVDWQVGKITTAEIQQWAEEKYMGDEMRNSVLSEVDHFITIEALQYLESINMNLTTKDDIPFLLKFINSGKLCHDAYKDWRKYLDNIDYNKRVTELKDDPFYKEYCTGL